MTARRRLAAALLFAVPLTLASAASADGPSDRLSIELAFAAELGGRPVDCTTAYDGVGIQESPVSIGDFRLYVSDVFLSTAGGERVPMTLAADDRWQDGRVALLDFEDGTHGCDNGTPAMNDRVRGDVPDGDYVGVEFTIGVPFAANHGDPTLAGSPLNLTSMFWNWRGGYRFLKVDLLPVDSPIGAWMLHLGSTGCLSASRTTAPDDACASPNRVVVAFDAMDPAKDTIVIDPAALLRDSDLASNAPDTSPGCMSFPGDPDCAPVMSALGLAYGDAADVSLDTDAARSQQFVTLRRATR